ncbi:MAG: tRNA-dihydrouridine synthase [Gemmatimonadota bacterium]|jgi:dihydroorotate dehydrogenase (NAD+) catalytic subunit
MYNLLGKEIRGRFGFPSGVITTNSDVARWMFEHVPQFGFYQGKSTTIQPRAGNREDILAQPAPDALWNAVGYTNPGLEATIEGFRDLRASTPADVFLMAQIGESNEETFSHCVDAFEAAGDIADGYEVNVSCPHADKGGILIGSDPDSVRSITAATRKATKKPVIVKLNAGVCGLEEIAVAAVEGGADALSAINTIGGPNPELSNQFGGLSGAAIFPSTVDAITRLRKVVSVPIIAMGGIRGAGDIRRLEAIDPNLFYAIGTALGGLTSLEIQEYFQLLERDLAEGTDLATGMTLNRMLMDYHPFVVSEIDVYSDTVRVIKFRERLEADVGVGQFVFFKVGNTDSKPFSVAANQDRLELLVRDVGPMTHRACQLNVNDVVRIRGPYGHEFRLPEDRPVVLAGAGVGIAPIHHAAKIHAGPKRIFIGAVTAEELVYLDSFRQLGETSVSTDDGSAGFQGYIAQLMEKALAEEDLRNPVFLNCGPELAMKALDEAERRYAPPEDIFHVVERYTSCGIGICGKCSIETGERTCVDGPVHSSATFTPGVSHRDLTGKKIRYG